MDDLPTAEEIAKTFCEASGLYSWEDTKKCLPDLSEWYLTGAKAVKYLLSSQERKEEK